MNLIELLSAPSWQKQAACGQNDADLFFSKQPDDQVLAKYICARCPVRRDCLAWALETGQDEGILGGLTARERRQEHRRWKRPPKGAAHTTRAEQIASDPERLLTLLASEMTPAQVAREYRTNVQAINEAASIVKARQAAAVYATTNTGTETTS